MMNIAIIEDVSDYRKVLELIVNSAPDMYCSGAFARGKTAIEEIRRHPPDIILLDLQLPDMHGTEIIRKLKHEGILSQFLVLTVFEDDDKIMEALSAGATGYLLKESDAGQIINALRDIYKGGSPMSSVIARKVVNYLNKTQPNTNIAEFSLTKREKEILDLLSTGMLMKQIADRLFISIDTVKSHCHHIYEKLHVSTKTEALNKYFRR